GKINVASAGSGTTPHLAGELFKIRASIDWAWVQYRASLMPDLLAGHVQASFTPIPTSLGDIKTGKMHALSVTGTKRIEGMPNIPALNEFVQGSEASRGMPQILLK